MHIAATSFSPPVPLPLLARSVRAGFPSPADDFIEEEIDLQYLSDRTIVVIEPF